MPFRLIAEAIGRQFGLPAKSPPEKAEAHFGGLAVWVEGDGPASSERTRRLSGGSPRKWASSRISSDPTTQNDRLRLLNAAASGSRYLQQVCKHWGHKFEVEFSETRGQVDFEAAAN